MLRFKRRLAVQGGVNMTAMIDVLLVLIIFFMVSSTLVKSRGIQVNVPESRSAESETRNLLVVSIKRPGELYLNDEPVDASRLGSLLRKRSQELGQDVVIIKGDQQIPYAKMVEVMDLAKMAGMKKISLDTKRRN
ncbi:MAG: biopolymer transporter ExbD [Spirochaetia bacterium]|nr:biopolymer transporter ExbD [Spirochaetia bacterium]